MSHISTAVIGTVTVGGDPYCNPLTIQASGSVTGEEGHDCGGLGVYLPAGPLDLYNYAPHHRHAVYPSGGNGEGRSGAVSEAGVPRNWAEVKLGCG
jgi:hypothetical protein